ncbi:hypothetical protein CNY89_26485, partial [Amaricoccus sp. HAR-UPW-R2A-40]
KSAETKAGNDARFAELLAKFDILSAKIDGLPSTWKVIGIVGSALGVSLGIVFAVLAFAGDRFDGGIGVTAASEGLARQNAAAIQEVLQSNEVLGARVDQAIRAMS